MNVWIVGQFGLLGTPAGCIELGLAAGPGPPTLIQWLGVYLMQALPEFLPTRSLPPVLVQHLCENDIQHHSKVVNSVK